MEWPEIIKPGAPVVVNLVFSFVASLVSILVKFIGNHGQHSSKEDDNSTNVCEEYFEKTCKLEHRSTQGCVEHLKQVCVTDYKLRITTTQKIKRTYPCPIDGQKGKPLN